MALTSRGIWTPDSTDAYALTTHLATTAGTIDTELVGSANYGVGTTTQRNAALAKYPNGALWYDTTLSSEYRKVAGAWVGDSSTLTVASGYTLTAGSSVVRSGRIVSITFNINKTAGGAIPRYTTVATIPAGFRPAAGVRFGGAGILAGVDDYTCSFGVDALGALFLNSVDSGASVTSIEASASWPI